LFLAGQAALRKNPKTQKWNVERGVREIGEQLNHRNNMEMGYNI